MTVAFVQSTGIQIGSNVANDSASFGVLPAVGNHVITTIANYNTTKGMDAVTDNQSNSYAEDFDQHGGAGRANGNASIYSGKVATSAGTFTVTIDPTAASTNFLSWASTEFSGLDATTWKDQTGGSESATGDALATATGANSTADGLAIAVAFVDNLDADINISDTPPTGYTQIAFYEAANDIAGFSAVYKIYSGSETSSAQFTHDNTSQIGWAACIVTYKAVAALGGNNNLLAGKFGMKLVGKL